ncbi:MAG: lipopolysaccharide biosynthesis protein [Treponema sp.]|nr:lipopolysaccharide biosynthesis protein [Treponema sp.]MBR7079689.1 lipopolysaccharide biosynthesis protein [Treponema sp.]
MINVLFCGNDKVFDGILTCMLSIFKRTKTTEPFNFYIFTMDVSHIKPEYICISDEQVQFLSDVAKKQNPENKITKVDVTDLYNKEFANSPNEQCYCSPYTLLRLLADLIPSIPEKFLYLDADLLFNDDITKLYNIDVSDYEYAAAPDHYGKLILFWQRKFINAGVILFNVKKCRETGLFEKSRNEIKAHKLTFADESAIIRSTTKQLKISQRFNDQKFLYKKTVIRHFSKRLFWLPYPHVENIKQWNWAKMMAKFKYTCFKDVLEDYIYYKRKFELEG